MTKESNPCLFKPPLDFKGGLSKLGLTAVVQGATGVSRPERDLRMLSYG